MGHELDPETAQRIFEIATRIKVTDAKVRALLMSGQFQATYYSPAGHEIVAATAGALLRPDDYVCTTYRGMHDQVAKGVPLDLLLAEYFGRQGGACRGKGGPMHITHRDSNLLLTTGIVGSGLPIGVGLAWAASLRKQGQVVVVNFGDGASNIGAFHESLNLAALWKLPVIFVCANNRYAEHTPFDEGTASATVAQRADSYDMPGVRVDGNDAASMHAAMSDAIARARSGGGPTLIEAMTFRFHGHNMNDTNKYMQEGELDAARAEDPVDRLAEWLVGQGILDEAGIAEVRASAQAEIDAAVAYAAASPIASVDDLWTDVYAEGAVR